MSNPDRSAHFDALADEPFCRDCADENGICPHDGHPCGRDATPASAPPEPIRTTKCPRPHHLLLAGERCPTCRTEPARSSAEEGTTTGEAMVNGFWRKMDALTSPAASPPEGAAGEPLTIALAKREAHAEALTVTGVCDKAEAERRAKRYYPLPSEPRVA